MAEQQNMDRGLKKTIDWSLIICYALLVVTGLFNIYASIHSSEPTSIFDWNCRSGKQFVWILSSFVLAAVILFVMNPGIWEVLATPSYLVTCILLVLVIFLSKDVKGSHSWFELGPIKFQPAELSKITTSLLLALQLSKPNFKISSPSGFISAIAIIGLPMLIIIAESETGSALVYVGFIFVLYREGLSGWFIVFIAMAIVLFILSLTTSWWVAYALLTVSCALYFLATARSTKREPIIVRRRVKRRIIEVFAIGIAFIYATGFVFEKVLQPHQRARIEVLLGLKEDPSGVGYNVRQSMIAIGSGGLLGKGYLKGTQTTYGFVPEQSTDFIFCTVGEEWGFVGSSLIILLYGFMIFRIIKDSESIRSPFTRIYGYSLASCLFMHLCINIGMTVGLMPVIGIPLPFLSYGGSSLWAFTTMLFIFIALYKQEKKYF